MSKLSLEVVQSQLSKQQRRVVGEETIEEINKLAEDPEYGEEFLSTYIDVLNVLNDSPKNTHRQYLNAVKFFSLVEADNKIVDAYIKVFPERYEARKRNHPDGDKDIISGEASRYNASKLVSEIRRVATSPVHLIHRHILHEAILETANLMRTGRSEFVRQKAAATLIAELKPPEENQLNIKVEDNSTNVIAELHKATQELAARQYENIQAGISTVKDVAQARILPREEDTIEDAEFEEADD